MLKAFLERLLKDEARFKGAINTGKVAAKSLRQIWRANLNSTNGFLRLVEWSFRGHGWGVHYSNKKSTGRLACVFNETGIIIMFEASDYEALDMVSRSTGVIVDCLCELDSGSITKKFTLYADPVRFVHRRRMRLGWTEREIDKHCPNPWLTLKGKLEWFLQVCNGHGWAPWISLVWTHFRRPVVSWKQKILGCRTISGLR